VAPPTQGLLEADAPKRAKRVQVDDADAPKRAKRVQPEGIGRIDDIGVTGDAGRSGDGDEDDGDDGLTLEDRYLIEAAEQAESPGANPLPMLRRIADAARRRGDDARGREAEAIIQRYLENVRDWAEWSVGELIGDEDDGDEDEDDRDYSAVPWSIRESARARRILKQIRSPRMPPLPRLRFLRRGSVRRASRRSHARRVRLSAVASAGDGPPSPDPDADPRGPRSGAGGAP
jgi:hypothetical protein